MLVKRSKNAIINLQKDTKLGQQKFAKSLLKIKVPVIEKCLRKCEPVLGPKNFNVILMQLKMNSNEYFYINLYLL